MSLINRMIILISIPSMLCLFLSTRNLMDSYNKAIISESFVKNANGISKISNLIDRLQVERGSSAVFMMATNDKKYKPVNDAINKTNAFILGARSFIENGKGLLHTQLLNQIDSIESMRSMTKNGENVKKMLKSYTKLIADLRVYIGSLAKNSNDKIIVKMAGIMTLELAKENSGLMRANLSGALSRNKAIDFNFVSKLFKLKNGVATNLNAESISLSDEANRLRKDFFQSKHWLESSEVFDHVINKSKEGDFKYDASEFFATISKSVAAIKEIINKEIDATVHIAKNISAAKHQQIYSESILIILAFSFLIAATHLIFHSTKQTGQSLI